MNKLSLDPDCDRVAIELLTELVRIPSVSRSEATATSWLTEQMQGLGFQAQVDQAGNAVGIRERPDDNGEINETAILLGHIDTVPGEIPLRVEAGNLYGRGSVDAKGSLATFVMSAARAKLKPGLRLIVIGAVEEEVTSSKGARYVATQYQPDWCVIGEPSSAEAVTLGYKGRLQLELKLVQPSAHSAGPQIPVAEYAVEWWMKVKNWCEQFNQDLSKIFEQVQVGLSDVNTEHDGFAEAVTARVGLRLPVGFPKADFVDQCRQYLDEVKSSSELEAELRDFGYEIAHQEGRTSPLVQRFNRVFRGNDLKPRHKLKTGTSDMNVVAPVWNCPIVAYGPGDSSLDHTPHEHILLAEYLQAINLLRSVLE